MRVFLVLLLGIGCFNLAVFAQPTDEFYDEVVIDNFELPVGITFNDLGRGYLWSQDGKVWTFDKDGVLRDTPFIDISEEVLNWKDHGLTGFALDNEFLINGYVYLLYAADRHHVLHHGTPEYDPDLTIEGQATIGRVTRYTANEADDFNSIISESRKVLLGQDFADGIPILMISHGMGDIAQAKDGTLLISTGDAGAYESADTGSHEASFFEQAIADGILKEENNMGSFRSLLLNSTNGKVLRIDAETGDGISSNPYYEADAPRAARSRVWLTGFRNPFRFVLNSEEASHFPEDGDIGTLYIGDVGAAAWEELNISTEAGQCFGWPAYEGSNTTWEYETWKHTNPESQNPLFGSEACTRQQVPFSYLIQNPNASGAYFFPNPCDSTKNLAGLTNTFVHTPPAITWSNAEWNLPERALAPTFDSLGLLQFHTIEGEQSTVEGENFGGYTSVPGFIYRAGNFPEHYQNPLFGADLVGWIKAFFFDENGNLERVEPFFDVKKGITDLAIHPTNDCIYYTQIYDNQVHKICYGGNPKPIVDLQLDQYYGQSPLTVNFDASNSYAPKGHAVQYQWDFGDGTTSETASPRHVFEAENNQAQSFQVTLTITDSLGTSASKTQIVSVNNTPPEVAISSFQDGDRYAMNGVTILPLEAEVSDEEHSEEELSYVWQTFLHHNAHYHPDPKITDRNSTFLLEPVGCAAEDYWYRVRLTVTDAHGLSSTDERELFPYCDAAFVSFVDLLAQKTSENAVQLSWESSLEEGVSHYEIQRTNTFMYTTIQSIDATNATTYNFLDTAPLEGDNIYRIKAVRTDGAYEFSNPTYINFSKTLPYVFYPNPTGEAVYLELDAAFANKIRVQLHDISGRLIMTKEWDAQVGQKFQERIDLTRFANGVYHAKVFNGTTEIQQKLLVVY